MSRKILVDIRDVYGRESYYPANDAARLLAGIAGTTTLTPAALDAARKLGFEVDAQRVSKLNEGARIADDFFCSGCGKRGVVGFCQTCARG